MPVRKHGLKGETENSGAVDVKSLLTLTESEWFCPYCLSAPIQRYWKRGVPQFLYYHQNQTSLPSDDRNPDPNPDPDPETSDNNVSKWTTEIGEFVDSLKPSQSNRLFPPNILLAMSGVRRAIQRVGPLYHQLATDELQKGEPLPEPTLPEEDMAEPLNATDSAPALKAPIMRSVKTNHYNPCLMFKSLHAVKVNRISLILHTSLI